MALLVGRHHVADLAAQALDIFKPAQFLDRADGYVAVRSDTEPAFAAHVETQREDAVAQIGFGGRADTRHRTAVGHHPGFHPVDVGGMDQAPALVDIEVGVEPGHRTQVRPRLAVFDFLGLLCDMNVDRCGRVHAVEAGNGLRKHTLRDRA